LVAFFHIFSNANINDLSTLMLVTLMEQNSNQILTDMKNIYKFKEIMSFL